MIVNPFTLIWKNTSKNVVKSYLTIPVAWATVLLITCFSGVVFYSKQTEWFTLNGIKPIPEKPTQISDPQTEVIAPLPPPPPTLIGSLRYGDYGLRLRLKMLLPMIKNT